MERLKRWVKCLYCDEVEVFEDGQPPPARCVRCGKWHPMGVEAPRTDDLDEVWDELGDEYDLDWPDD